MSNLVPKDFQVPDVFETDRFRLRMLRVTDVVKDYDAVMSSIEHLRKTMPFGPDHVWPTRDLSFEQDLIDLGWHHKEFQRRTSFAYTVMRLDETECLGCVYIYPTSHDEYDAEIIMWVRQSEVETGLDDYLFAAVKQWIKDRWPFAHPGYPGREIDWNTWKSVP
jgi:RimJ/RimL family protein N-acetyltransferase